MKNGQFQFLWRNNKKKWGNFSVHTHNCGFISLIPCISYNFLIFHFLLFKVCLTVFILQEHHSQRYVGWKDEIFFCIIFFNFSPSVIYTFKVLSCILKREGIFIYSNLNRYFMPWRGGNDSDSYRNGQSVALSHMKSCK